MAFQHIELNVSNEKKKHTDNKIHDIKICTLSLILHYCSLKCCNKLNKNRYTFIQNFKKN